MLYALIVLLLGSHSLWAWSDSENWIAQMNRIDEFPPAQYLEAIEQIRESMEANDYIRYSEQIASYVADKSIGSTPPNPVERQYVLWREAYYLQRQLEEGKRSPDLRENAGIAMRKLGHLPDRFAFAELTVDRLSELLTGGYDIGDPPPIPIGARRWEIVFTVRKNPSGIINDFSSTNSQAASSRRSELTGILQFVGGCILLPFLCPRIMRWDDDNSIRALNHPVVARVFDRNGIKIDLSELESWAVTSDGKPRVFR